jgi:NitT/TauT family transport system substrate-binding protein
MDLAGRLVRWQGLPLLEVHPASVRFRSSLAMPVVVALGRVATMVAPPVLRRVLPLLLMLSALLAGCTRSEPAATSPLAARAPLRRIVLQADWFPQAEQGGFYQALARGFYAEVGLAVEILPGGPGAGIELKLARGEADFALMKSDDAIVAVARGLPFVMVMAALQHDPQALIVHADSPVRDWSDLNGRVVIASPSMTWIPYLQRRYGITFSLRPNTYGLGEFLANRAAVQQGFVTARAIFRGPARAPGARAAARGLRLRLLPGSGHAGGVLRTDPAAVRAFVAASTRGWMDYVSGDPAPGNGLILARNREMTPELLTFSRDEMIRRGLVTGDPVRGERVGKLALPRVTALIDTLVSLQVLDAPLPVAKVATDALQTSAP